MTTTLITGAHFATPPTELPHGYVCQPYAGGYIVGKLIATVDSGEAVAMHGHFVNGVALDLGVETSAIEHWVVSCEN